MKDFIWYLSVALGVAFALLVTEYAFADNKTVIQYQGQPVRQINEHNT